MIDEASAEEFADLVEGLRDEFYNQIDFGTAVSALGSRWLLLLTHSQMHLLHAEDDNKDIVLLRDEIQTSLRLSDRADSDAELVISGIADFSILLPNAEAIVLRRELDRDTLAVSAAQRRHFGRSFSKTSSAEGGQDQPLRSARQFQTLAIGAGVASLFLYAFGIVPLISLGIAVISWQKSAKHQLGWIRPLVATSLSLLGLLMYLSFYGYL